MSMIRRIIVVLLTAVISAFGVKLGEQFSIPGMYGIFPSAQAIVGRPLTR